MTAEPIFSPSWSPSPESQEAWSKLFHPFDISNEKPPETGFLTVEEAAQQLGIDVAQTLRLIDSEALCAVRDSQTGKMKVKEACVRAQVVGDTVASSDERCWEPHLIPQVQIDTTKFVQPEKLSTPDDGGSVSAAENLLTIIESATTTPSAPPAVEAPSLDRAAVTSKNVEAIMDSLDFANVRLEGAMYRIGYLEAQVDSLQEQLKVLPDFRARAARAIITERENDMLQETVDEVNALNDALKITVKELEEDLDLVNSHLDKLEGNWWFRVLSWLLGIPMRARV